MKKNILVALLMLVIIINSLFLLLSYYNYYQDNNRRFLINQYQIQKINEISDKIINREVVEKAYFYYLDKELIDEIEQYNKKTGEIKQFFTGYALVRISDICQVEGIYFIDKVPSVLYKPIDYTKMPSDIHNLIDILVKHSLQKNCTDLIYADSSLLQIIVDSFGGSYGMWPINWHSLLTLESSNLPYSELMDYFASTKDLLKKLENYKYNLY